MVHSETPGPAGGDQSLGDLVALAAKDVSQLIRYEVDLAKAEFKGDAKRVGIAVAGFGLAAFVGCLVLVLLCFALAFGLVALGIWEWAAFLIVAAPASCWPAWAGPGPAQAAQALWPARDPQDRDRRPGDAAPRRTASRDRRD